MFFVLIDPSHFEVDIARASVEPSWPPTSSALRARFARPKSSCSAARRTCGHCWWRFLKSLDSMHGCVSGKTNKNLQETILFAQILRGSCRFSLSESLPSRIDGLLECHVPYDSTEKNGLHQRLDECNRLFSMASYIFSILQQHPHGCWVNLSSLIVNSHFDDQPLVIG